MIDLYALIVIVVLTNGDHVYRARDYDELARCTNPTADEMAELVAGLGPIYSISWACTTWKLTVPPLAPEKQANA